MEKHCAVRGGFTLAPKKIALLGIFTACALVSFILENLLPPLLLPGAKLGLSNVFTLLCIIMCSPADALLLIVVRTLLGCVITGNIAAIAYSLTAGVVCVIISSLLIKFVYPRISIIAVSVFGAVCHNIVQNIVFCLISDTPQMFAYMPYLALLGVVSGIVVGGTVFLLLHKIPLSFYEKVLENKTLKEEKRIES